MKQEKRKKELKKIYDIIPPTFKKGLVVVEEIEKKISIRTKAFYLFLKTSKYGSAVLILGIALLGGTLIMGFSPKTEITEIYPTQYEGDWRNMGKALDRNILDDADVSEFNHSNSAGVVEFGENTDKEEQPEEIIPDFEEEIGESEIENEEIQGSGQKSEPAEGEQEDPIENIEIEEDNETNPPAPEVLLDGQAGSIQSMEPTESSNEELSFFERTKNIFSIPEARAEEIVSDEVFAQNEDVAVEEAQDDQDLDEKQDLEQGEKGSDGKEVIEDDRNKNSEGKEEMVQVGDTELTDENEETQDSGQRPEPTKGEPTRGEEDKGDNVNNEDSDKEATDADADESDEDKEEKFEDYSGIIIIPDIDGNLFFEAEEDKKKEKAQTIFTEELSAVYSGFSVSEKSGELRKVRIGFSFGSLKEENEDDEIIISWSLDGQDWNTVSEFVLNENYSNKSNGGYFYADVFDLSDSNQDVILEWKDIKNIKIKFSYLTNNSEENYAPFFLNAVWLKTESEEPDEEPEEEKRIEVLSHKKDFKINEDPKFKFKYKKEKRGVLDPLFSITETIGLTDYWKGINLTAEVISPDRKVFKIPGKEFGNVDEIFSLDKNGEISIKLKKDTKFKPGLYKIILKVEENGKMQTFEQDFTWGVLAINVNKSIYLPGEEAYLQMGVLRDNGHTVCDANLVLSIKYPSNSAGRQVSSDETILSTEDGTILYSGECNGNNVTDVPDYFAYYTTGEAGVYEMKLTNLDNGYEITDSFEVRDSVPFDIERIGPSRIYPPADYEMVLKIKVNEDFIGFIQEKVPALFVITEQELKIKNLETGEVEIYESQFIDQDESENNKLLRWYDIDLKQNDELEIRYTFDAPDVSPDLHLLGPLGFYE